MLGPTQLNPPFACSRIADTLQRHGVNLVQSNSSLTSIPSICRHAQSRRKTITPSVRKSAAPTPAVIDRDYTKLKSILSVFGLAERNVLGDGNCQYRALADQMFGDESHHEAVRKRVCLQLEAHSSDYMDFVPVYEMFVPHDNGFSRDV